MSMDILSDCGMPNLPSIIKPKTANEGPTKATVTSVRVNGIKVKFGRRVGKFE